MGREGSACERDPGSSEGCTLTVRALEESQRGLVLESVEGVGA